MHYVKRSICIMSYISQRFIFVSVRRVPSLWYYSLQNKEDKFCGRYHCNFPLFSN